MILEGKKILIFSPQPWNHISISKHHYAFELSEKNQVFFFSAPSGFGLSVNSSNINERLKVFDYQIPFPQSLRFKYDKLYKRTIQYFLKKIIIKEIGSTDICIDFGCDRFIQKLDFLDAKKKLYFRVDDSPDFKPSLRGADFILSVSMNIVEKYAAEGIECHYINHGLSTDFISQKRSLNTIKEDKIINAGYAGNMLIPHIDREMIIRTIVQNKHVNFHFFGVVQHPKMNDNQRQWIAALKSQPNVILHGVLPTDKLVLNFQYIDIFLLCYKSDSKSYHSDNSHKILEYLSTGKVIVSSWIRHYAGLELFPMCNENDNRDYADLFKKILNDLSYYNSDKLAQQRINYALNNSYKYNIQKIAAFIYVDNVNNEL
jgi:hypothetical protein